MGGGKKRKSLNNSEQNGSLSIKQPLSGDESDYGVLSDPDENVSIPIMSNASEQSPAPAPAPAPVESVTIDNVIECDNVIIQTSSSKETKETKETVDPVILQTLQKEEEEDDTHCAGVGQPQLYDKSLDLLKIKLEKSIESNKLSHTTFLWFIVTVMEIDNELTQALTKVSNPESYDTKNPERLIEYIIKTHSLNNEVEQYTLKMLQLGVVSHIMKGLIEFNVQLNKNEKRQGIIYPYMKSLERLNPDDKAPAPAPAPASNDPIDKPNKFIAFCKNIFRCCRCCYRRSRKDSILTEIESLENSNEQNATPAPTPAPTATPNSVTTPDVTGHNSE